MAKSKSMTITKADQWAAEIRQQMGKSVESIIAVGRLLINAKADVVHGEWERMFSDGLVPLNKRTAEKFMAIASHPLISNSSNLTLLPPVWTTLYALTEVEPTKLKNALHDKVITPAWKGSDVKALMPPKPDAPKAAQKAIPAASEPAQAKTGEQWFVSIKTHIEAALTALAPEARHTLVDSLVVLLTQLEQPTSAATEWATASRAD